MIRTEAKLVAVLVLFSSAAVTYALISRGGLYDDDISHYLAARYAWTHREILVDVWDRPVYTILASPLAQLGMDATRYLNVALSVLTCFVAFRIAKSLGLREPWLAAAFTAIQPLFFRLSFGTLTEPSFGLLLSAAILFYYERRLVASALCMSALPLARLEGFAFLFVWVLLLLRQRALKPILCLALFPVLWVLSSFVISGDPLYLLHSNPYFVGDAHPEATAKLGTKLSHWADYLIRWPGITGPVLVPLISLGLMYGVWRRGRLVHFVTMAYFIIQAMTLMSGGIGFITAGNEEFYTRLFVSVAPLLGVIGAQAAQYILVELPANRKPADGRKLDSARVTRLMILVVTAQTCFITWWYFQSSSRVGRLDLVASWLVTLTALVLWAWKQELTATHRNAWLLLTLAIGVTYTARWVEPYHIYPSGRLSMTIGQWLMASELKDRPLIVLNPSFWLGTDRDPFDRSGLEAFYAAGGYPRLPHSIPEGVLVVWDSTYFPPAHVPLESLDPATFRVIREWSTTDNPADPFYRDGERLFKMAVLEKIH